MTGLREGWVGSQLGCWVLFGWLERYRGRGVRSWGGGSQFRHFLLKGLDVVHKRIDRNPVVSVHLIEKFYQGVGGLCSWDGFLFRFPAPFQVLCLVQGEPVLAGGVALEVLLVNTRQIR